MRDNGGKQEKETSKKQKADNIQTWNRNGRSFIFACVVPQARDAAIRKQRRRIRDGYLKN